MVKQSLIVQFSACKHAFVLSLFLNNPPPPGQDDVKMDVHTKDLNRAMLELFAPGLTLA